MKGRISMSSEDLKRLEALKEIKEKYLRQRKGAQYYTSLLEISDVDSLGPELVLPGFNNLFFFTDHLNAIGQYFFLREIKGLISPFSLNWINDLLLRIIPETNGHGKREVFQKNAAREIPGNQEPLSFGRLRLSRIRCVYMGAS